jgi:hypothetical protein
MRKILLASVAACAAVLGAATANAQIYRGPVVVEPGYVDEPVYMVMPRRGYAQPDTIDRDGSADSRSLYLGKRGTAPYPMGGPYDWR